MLAVIATVRLAGFDRLSRIVEFPLLAAVGCFVYVGFVAVFGRRAVLDNLSFVTSHRCHFGRQLLTRLRF
jgi:hypothetical protein